MVNSQNFQEKIRDVRTILDYALDTHRLVFRIYDLVQSNTEFFNGSPGADKLELAVLKLETLVDQWRHERDEGQSNL